MPEPSWAEGYVVDVGYTHGFFAELAPSALAFTALLGQTRAPDFTAPFTYYELGCGQGHTTAVLAAANPAGRFYGVDFNPAHIHNAQALARDGSLDNATFLEKSFAELPAMDLPEADVVALHGVWSWVSAENRGHIVEFLRRRLKPGGLTLVSYNALPGLAQVAPLQRLLAEHGRAAGGEAIQRVQRGLDFARRLEQAGANYFKLNPLARQRLAQLGRHDPRYVAHEYHNASWTSFYHADVAQDLAQAKLGFAASAITQMNFPQFVVPAETVKLLAEAGDRTTAETWKDFAANTVFRKDLFTRGAPKASPQELERLLEGARFALVRGRSRCTLQLKTTAGEINLHADLHAPVLDALVRGPQTFAELSRAPECARFDRVRLRQALFALAAAENIAAALPAAGDAARQERTRRFNAAVLARPSSEYTTLASPVLGSGFTLSLLDRLFLSAGETGEAAIESVRRAAERGGIRLKKGDRPAANDEEAREVLRGRAERFFGEVLPLCRALGVA